jgi:hypothetical protein
VTILEMILKLTWSCKTIQKYLPVLKKGTNPSILLFSIAVKLGMPFH